MAEVEQRSPGLPRFPQARGLHTRKPYRVCVGQGNLSQKNPRRCTLSPGVFVFSRCFALYPQAPPPRPSPLCVSPAGGTPGGLAKIYDLLPFVGI